MLISREIKEELCDLFYVIKLQDRNGNTSLDKKVKIEQVLAYLEVLHAEVRKISKKKKLVMVDSAAGNCYLAYLVNYFYQHIEKREFELHCVDYNVELMSKNADFAKKMGFSNMHFHAKDIGEFSLSEGAQVVYSLHACDTATDKTMHLGIRLGARVLLSVSCCQHSLKLKSKELKALTRYTAFRNKLLMMVSDSLRALLLEEQGYKVDVIEFVSTRFTEKNNMVKAFKTDSKKDLNIGDAYQKLSDCFSIEPFLKELVEQ